MATELPVSSSLPFVTVRLAPVGHKDTHGLCRWFRLERPAAFQMLKGLCVPVMQVGEDWYFNLISLEKALFFILRHDPHAHRCLSYEAGYIMTRADRVRLRKLEKEIQVEQEGACLCYRLTDYDTMRRRLIDRFLQACATHKVKTSRMEGRRRIEWPVEPETPSPPDVKDRT